MGRRLPVVLAAAVAGAVLVAGAPALAAWTSSRTGSATAKAGTWGQELHWTGPAGGACANANSCSVIVGNNADFTTKVEVTDASGNVLSNVGAGRTVTVSIQSRTSGGQFTAPTSGTANQSLALPATGPAVTTVSFTYRTGSGSWTSDVLTASSGSYSGATATLKKQ